MLAFDRLERRNGPAAGVVGLRCELRRVGRSWVGGWSVARVRTMVKDSYEAEHVSHLPG